MKKILLLALLTLTLSAQTLVLGIVPRYNLNQIRDQWQPLIDKVSKKTGIKIVLRTEKGVSQFLQAFKTGKYDLAYSNPGHYIITHKLQGYEAILSSQKMLRGMIVSSSENKELQIIDLENALFSFPSKGAFAATVMTRVGVYDKYGFDILKTKPIYSNTLQKSMLDAKQKISKASGTAFDVFNRAAPSFKAGLKVLYISKPAASHPISIHPRVSKEDREKIVNAFLSLSDSELQGLALESIKEVNDMDYKHNRELLNKNTLLDKIMKD